MIKSRQLYDAETGVHYYLDTQSLLLKISSDQMHKETRLKPYFAEILALLFAQHPQTVSYAAIMTILARHRLVCPDETRLHRKVSDLRRFLAKLHPGSVHLILNTRGIGYSLPLHFKDPELQANSSPYKISHKKLQDVVVSFEGFAKKSLFLSKQCHIMQLDIGFVLQRSAVHAELEQLLASVDKQKKHLYTELRLHPADFASIRLDFVLAKLKTYLGLARISEFAVSKEQWLEWHEIELKQALGELVCLLRFAEAQ